MRRKEKRKRKRQRDVKIKRQQLGGESGGWCPLGNSGA
jgi:hypothetical protein